MAGLAEYQHILQAERPLAPLTRLRIGGPAQWLARPTELAELAGLVRRCVEERIRCRVLGGGSNVLVPDEGVRGVVIHLDAPAFQDITVQGTVVTAGAAARLPAVISEACKANASGLEDLVGIPGTVGGALRCNAGGRTGDIGQFVHSVQVMDEAGAIVTRMRADIRFGYRTSSLDDGIILSATFHLLKDDPDNIDRRIKKIWIAKKASQPFEFQAAAYVFQNSRGLNAAELIDKAGLTETRVGGAEISSRDPKFIVANEGATCRDVLRLIDLVRSKVQERLGIDLQLQLDVWQD